MLQIERREQILQLLSHTAALRVTELAKMLYTSEATVRRDITAMESARKCRLISAIRKMPRPSA